MVMTGSRSSRSSRLLPGLALEHRTGSNPAIHRRSNLFGALVVALVCVASPVANADEPADEPADDALDEARRWMEK
ncbi:MAG: hypothetical protein ACOCXM_10630, partial [Myxococcota bacterium]